MELRFTWAPRKAKSNLEKHKVSFETASEVFSDPNVLITENGIDDETGEPRYDAIGYSTAGIVLLFVVFVDRSDESEPQVLRIISARKANPYEQSTYADQFA